MTAKLNKLMNSYYLSCCFFISSFKKDTRALSGVTVAILLILIGILCVVFIWAGLSGWLQDLWTRITGYGDRFQEIT